MNPEFPSHRKASLRWRHCHRPAIRSLFLLTVIATGLLTGCNDRKARQLVFSAKEAQLIEAYYGSDVKVAEKALLDMSQLLREAQRQQIEKRDYNWTLGLAHGRLALLYERLGKNADAEEHFRKAISHMDEYVVRRGGNPSQRDPGEKRAELIEVIEMLDQNREVKWKVQQEAPFGLEATNRNATTQGKPSGQP
jgi:hypothetical protein